MIDDVRIYVNNNTDTTKSQVKSLLERVKAIQEDPKKQERLAKQLCVYCYYSGCLHLGLENQSCLICGGIFENSSIPRDKVCSGCAKENKLCRHCGADVSLKLRRQKNDTS